MRSNIGTAAGRPAAASPTSPAAAAGTRGAFAGAAPFHSPPLRRLLTGWAAEAACGAALPPPRPATDDLADRLGRWLAWTDAVDLSAALHQPPAADPGAAGAPSVAVLAQALARLQADQARAIATDPVYLPGSDTALDAGDDAAPYRRAAQARQRAMAAAVAPLRARLRGALAAASPAGAGLAALDATLEAALDTRARLLLAGVAGRITQRLQHWRGQAVPDWRGRFHHDLQQALLAELDLRLQPLHGLLDALRQEAGA